MSERKNRWAIWLARFPIVLVFFFNVQCAVAFLISPDRYAPSFELNGVIGRSMIQAMGILFLMWNVPYLIAIIHPIKHITSLIEAVAMQFIGGMGETIIYFGMLDSHQMIKSSIFRFMIFDWGGWLLLVLALVLARKNWLQDR